MKENRITALDVGSTKAVMTIGRLTPEGVEVIGLGKVDHEGVRQGQVVNMVETSQAIMEARKEAELTAGVRLSQTYLSVTGQGAKTLSSRGLVPVVGTEVSPSDIDRVLEVAKAIHIPEQSRILHALPQSFTLDGQEGIENPLSMQGIRLEVDARLITVSEKGVANLLSAISKTGLKVKQVVLSQYASALATLQPEEKEMGVTLVEIGGGTCDLLVYKDSRITHVGTIPVGGLNFSQDVAVGLKTSLHGAEAVKKKYGTALVDMVGEDEMVDGLGLKERKTRQVTRLELSRILEARAEETLSLIFNQLNEWDVLKGLGAGVVFTGGGSLLPGLLQLAEFTFDVSVRRGEPEPVMGMKEACRGPLFSTVLGTLLFASGQEFPSSLQTTKGAGGRKNKTGGKWEQVKTFMGKALSI